MFESFVTVICVNNTTTKCHTAIRVLHCRHKCYILHIVNVTVCNITKFFSSLLEVAPPFCTSYTTAQALAIHTDFLSVGTRSVILLRSIKFMYRQVLEFLNTSHSEPSRNSFFQIPIISGPVFWHYTLLFTYIVPYCCNSE